MVHSCSPWPLVSDTSVQGLNPKFYSLKSEEMHIGLVKYNVQARQLKMQRKVMFRMLIPFVDFHKLIVENLSSDTFHVLWHVDLTNLMTVDLIVSHLFTLLYVNKCILFIFFLYTYGLMILYMITTFFLACHNIYKNGVGRIATKTKNWQKNRRKLK